MRRRCIVVSRKCQFLWPYKRKKKNLLAVGQRDSNLIIPYGIQNLQSLAHVDKVCRVMKIKETPTKFSSL